MVKIAGRAPCHDTHMCMSYVHAGEGDGQGTEGTERQARGTAVAARHAQPRNVRARVAALRRARGEGPRETGLDDSGEEEVDGGHVEELMGEMLDKEERKVGGGKIGTKKLKRIQEKAEKKVAREVRRSLGI